MPTFCRHNRLIGNCPICTREQAMEVRPVLSSSAPRSRASPAAAATGARRSPAPAARSAQGVKVRRLARGADDGYRSRLAPGLRSSSDAGQLAAEVAFAATRLQLLQRDPPGLYAELADRHQDLEERLWLAFLIAYLGPAAEPDDPFAAIAAARTTWGSGELPEPGRLHPGPRGAHDPRRGHQTLQAYRGWAQRAGSQQTAFTGDPAWAPQRRFARVLERLALPGLGRDARYELLVVLGCLQLVPLQAATLALGGDNEVTLAAKRALGIGDPLLLERRAQTLADSAGVPLAALDLGLFNWERGSRITAGFPPQTPPDEQVVERVRNALEL